MISTGNDSEEPARFHATAAVIRRNRYLVPSMLALMVLAPLGTAIGVIAHLPFLAGLSSLLLMAGTGGGLYALFQNPWTYDEPGDIEAGREGVFAGGRLLLAREEIRAGFVLPNPRRSPQVRLQRRLRFPLEIRVRDEAEGRALLRALGLDATQRAATFATPSRALGDPKWSIFLGVVFAALYILLGIIGHSFGLGPYLTFLQLPILGAYLGFMFLTRTSLTVGADGILRSWLGNKEFWSYGEIEGVTSYVDQSFWRRQKWHGIRISLRSGEVVRIPISSQSWRSRTSVDLILQRIREAMESHRQGDSAADTALLARQTRTVPDWIQSLRAIGSGANLDHRTAPVAPEQLFQIVEDASLTPSARAGAAVALGGSLDGAGKLRLQGAAAAVAAPKLRIAIEAAASGDDAALTEALAEIEGDREDGRRAAM